jgi:hypothetical protein
MMHPGLSAPAHALSERAIAAKTLDDLARIAMALDRVPLPEREQREVARVILSKARCYVLAERAAQAQADAVAAQAQADAVAALMADCGAEVWPNDLALPADHSQALAS